MGKIRRCVYQSVRAAERVTGRDWYVDALRDVRRSYAERRASYVDALRDARRSYAEKRDALDMDHLGVLLGFWLAADSNCIDIGSNRGSVLQMLEERAPQGQHHAFEPIPRLARQLRESFPEVTVHELALADFSGTVEFTVVDSESYDGYSGITQSLRDLPADWPMHSVMVGAARLDDVLPSDLVPRFVKIDVEGAELAVLRGAQQVLSRWRPILFMEHGGRDDTGEIHDLLTGLGYSIYDVDGGGPYPDLDSMVAGAMGRTGWLWNWVCI